MKTINPLNAYKETQIKTANQSKLIIMLYDGAIRNINLAVECMKDKHHKFDTISSTIVKAQDIIAELMVSLDFERGGEIAANLFSIYTFMNSRLLDANLKKEEAPLSEVKKMLIELREAWAEAAKKADIDSESRGEGGVNIAG